MIIGKIEDHDVVYNEDDNTVFCKNTSVKAEALIEAYESGIDRVSLQSNLVLRNNGHEFTLGCFTLTPQLSKLLIKQVKRCLIKSKKQV